ncbi:MAG TPA: radical SAM protein [Patescibacteria group bacterium]|nr:radical SAM protein [Patescibacteria group bacterium]
MRLSNKIKSAAAMLKVKAFKKRVPLAVRWQLTNRCPNKCVYCDVWSQDSDCELSTAQIFTIIDSLREQGTQTVSFSGGEPLVRGDIGQILEYCRKKNISTSINSNGALVAQKIGQLRTIDLLKLSLDGPEEIHDRMANCKGSYRQVLRAAEIAKAKGIKTIFTTTLTKHNIAHLHHLLEVAEQFDTLVAFQPLKQLSKGLKDWEALMPPDKEYKQAIAGLIALKKGGNRRMRNSLDELGHIYHWPCYKKLECWAGKVFCMIGVRGELYPCDRLQYTVELPNCAAVGFKKAFASLPPVAACAGCGFCGTSELNFLLSLKPGIVGTINKIVS